MISKSTKRNPIIGRKVKTLKDIKNKGGTKINSGEVCTIIYSYRGYSIKSSDGKIITRVRFAVCSMYSKRGCYESIFVKPSTENLLQTDSLI